MIDLHSHILPGLDDGARTLEDSLAIARAAVAAGTETMVATPHADSRYRVTAPQRDAALDALREALSREHIPLEVLGGSEIALDVLLGLDEDARDSLRLGGGPYLLLECPLEQSGGAFDDYLASLLADGEHILLAHPERCPTFHRHPARLSRLVEEGALTAVTAGALVGRFGSTVRRFSLQMFRDGLVHSVTSDVHNAERRPPGMGSELDRAGLAWLAPWLTHDVPAAIIAGDAIPEPPPDATATSGERGPRRRWSLW